MVDKFSQVAGNVPVTNNDPNRRYTVIPLSMAILSSSILQKNQLYQKDQLTTWTRTNERAILRMAVVFGAIHEPRPTVL